MFSFGRPSSGRSKTGSEVSKTSRRDEDDDNISTVSRRKSRNDSSASLVKPRREVSRRDDDDDESTYKTAKSKHRRSEIAPSDLSISVHAQSRDDGNNERALVRREPDDRLGHDEVEDRYRRRTGDDRTVALRKDGQENRYDDDKPGRDVRRYRISENTDRALVLSGENGPSDAYYNHGDMRTQQSRPNDENDAKSDDRKSSRKESRSSRNERRSTLDEYGNRKRTSARLNSDGHQDSTRALNNHDAALPQNQFFSEPSTYTAPYRPPTLGLAADYYGDQGESVQYQPGVRPQGPAYVVNQEQLHLQTPTATSKPPPEPSASGQMGAAANYFTMNSASEAENATSSKPVKPGRNPSKVKPSPRSSPRPPNARPSHTGSSFNPLAAAAVGTGAGAAMEYFASKNDHSATQQYNQQSYSNGQVAQHHSGAQTQEPTDMYGADAYPPRTNQANSDGRRYGTAAAMGLAGAAAGAYMAHQHQESHHSSHQGMQGSGPAGSSQAGYSQSAFSGRQQQKLRRKRTGPLGKLANWWNAPQDVAQFEEYTEYIGVCRYCFDPNSEAGHGPRKHHYHKGIRRQSSRHGSNLRVDKTYRHSSSDDERKRSSRVKKAAAVGLAGLGAAKLGETFYNSRHDFDDTYSVKSGRPIPQQRTSYSRRDDHRTHNLYPSREDIQLSRKSSHGKLDRRQEDYHKNASRRRRSSSSSAEGLSRGNVASVAVGAAALGAAAEAAHRRHSRSHSRERPPGRRKYYSKRVSPKHSYVDLTATEQGTAGFGSFFSSPSANQNTGKKSKGIFTFSNASSSSSDADLAFGEGTIRRQSSIKSNSKRDKRKQAGHSGNDTAAIMGLAAAGAALAAQSDRKGKENKYADRRTDGRRINLENHESTIDGNDDIWEDASDDDSADDVDIALAYGGKLSATQSKESLTSQSSGTGKWDWRWNKNKKQREEKKLKRWQSMEAANRAGNSAQYRPVLSVLQPAQPQGPGSFDSPFERRGSNQINPFAVAAAGATLGALAASRLDMPNDPSPASLPMQHMDPMPLSDHATPTGATRFTSQPMNVVDASRIALQQPQPTSPTLSHAAKLESAAMYNPVLVRPDEYPSVKREVRSREDFENRQFSTATTPMRSGSPDALNASTLSKQSVSWDLTPEQLNNERRAYEKAERRRRKHDKEERRRTTDVVELQRKASEDDQRSEEADAANPSDSTRLESSRRASVGTSSRSEADIDAEIRSLHAEQKRKKEQRRRQQFEEEQRRKEQERQPNPARIDEREDQRHKSADSDIATAAIVAGAGVAAAAAFATGKEDSKSEVKRRQAELNRKRRSIDGEQASSDPNLDQRHESVSAEETAQQRIARRAARNVSRSPSPVHDDYKTFFLPQDIAATVEEHNRAAQRREEADAAIVDVVPVARSTLSSGRRRNPFDDNLYEIYGLDPGHRDPLSLPWKVPKLGLVEPTPPGSRTVSERDPHSPMVSAQPQITQQGSVKEVEPIGEPLTRKRSGSRVTFGDHDTWVYEERTPEYEHNDPVDQISKFDNEQDGSKEISKSVSARPGTFYATSEPSSETIGVAEESYRPRPERLYTLEDDAEEAHFLHKEQNNNDASLQSAPLSELPVVREALQEDHPPGEDIASAEPTPLDEQDLADLLGAKAFYQSPFAQTLSDVEIEAAQKDSPSLSRVETLPDETPRQAPTGSTGGAKTESYFDESFPETSRPSRTEARRAERASSQEVRDLEVTLTPSADVEDVTRSIEPPSTSKSAQTSAISTTNDDGREEPSEPNPSLRSAFMNVAAAAAAASAQKKRDRKPLPTAELDPPKLTEVDISAPRPASQTRRDRASSLTSKLGHREDSVFDYLASSSGDDKHKPRRAKSEVGATSKAAMIAAASAAIAGIGSRRTEAAQDDATDNRDPRRSLPDLELARRKETESTPRRSSVTAAQEVKDMAAPPEALAAAVAEPESYLPEGHAPSTSSQPELDFYAAETEKPKKRKSKRGSQIFDDLDPSKSMSSLPGTKDEELKSRRKSRHEDEYDDDDTRSVASTTVLRDDERRSKRKSKRDTNKSDDDIRSVASVPANEEQSRRKSKRSSKSYDDDDDDTRSVKSSSSKKDKKDKEDRKSGGFFSSIFSSSKTDVSTPKRKDSKSSRSEVGRRDDSEDEAKRKKKRSTKASASASVPDLSKPPADYEIFPGSSRRGTATDVGLGPRDRSTDDGFVSAQDEQSFLVERPEMPLPTDIKDVSTGTDGVSGLTQIEVEVPSQGLGKQEGTTVPEESHYMSVANTELKEAALANKNEDVTTTEVSSSPSRALSAFQVQHFDPVAAAAAVDSGEETAFEVVEKESVPRPRTQSIVQLAEQAKESVVSPTSKRVPLFKRLPITPRAGTKELASSPTLAPTSPLSAKVRQSRPKSTEFTSKEFRPLYLVERHTPVKADTPVMEDPSTLPSLPSSRTTSVAGSTDDLTRLVHGSLSDSETESKRGRADRRRSWSGGEAATVQEVLDSRSTTPVPSERQRAREQEQKGEQTQVRGRREVPKHLFHSPSELLQDPAFFAGLEDDDVVPRSASPLPSVVSTVDEQEFMSAESRPDTPTMEWNKSLEEKQIASVASSPPARRASPFRSPPTESSPSLASRTLTRTTSAEAKAPIISFPGSSSAGITPPSRSQSASPFKHRTSSGISARTAALFGGAALGLAIGGVAAERSGSRGHSRERDPADPELPVSSTDAATRRPSISVIEATPVETIRPSLPEDEVIVNKDTSADADRAQSVSEHTLPLDLADVPLTQDLPETDRSGDADEPMRELESKNELPHLLQDQADEVTHVLEDEAIEPAKQAAEVGDVEDIAIDHTRSWDETAKAQPEAEIVTTAFGTLASNPADTSESERVEPYIPTSEDVTHAYDDHSAFELAFASVVQARGLKGDTTRNEAMDTFLPEHNNAPFVPQDKVSPIVGSAASSMLRTPEHSPDEDRSLPDSTAIEEVTEPTFPMQSAGKKSSKKDKKKAKKERQTVPLGQLGQDLATSEGVEDQAVQGESSTQPAQDVRAVDLDNVLEVEDERRASLEEAEPVEEANPGEVTDRSLVNTTDFQADVSEPELSQKSLVSEGKKRKKNKSRSTSKDVLVPAIAATGLAAVGASLLHKNDQVESSDTNQDLDRRVGSRENEISAVTEPIVIADVEEPLALASGSVQDQLPQDSEISSKEKKEEEEVLPKDDTWENGVIQEARDAAAASEPANDNAPTILPTDSAPRSLDVSESDQLEEQVPWDFGLNSKQAKKKKKEMQRNGTWDARVTQEDIDAIAGGRSEAQAGEVPNSPSTDPILTNELVDDPADVDQTYEEPSGALEHVAWDFGLSSKQAKKKEKELRRQGTWDSRVTQEMVDEAVREEQRELDFTAQQTLPVTDPLPSQATTLSDETGATEHAGGATTSSPDEQILQEAAETTDEGPVGDVVTSGVLLDVHEPQVPDVVLDLLSRRRTGSQSANLNEAAINTGATDLEPLLPRTEDQQQTLDASTMSSDRAEHDEVAEPASDELNITSAGEPPLVIGEPSKSLVDQEPVEAAVGQSVDDTPAATEDDNWVATNKKSKKDKKKRKSAIDWTTEPEVSGPTQTESHDEVIPSEPASSLDDEIARENAIGETEFVSPSSSKKAKKDKKKGRKQSTISESVPELEHASSKVENEELVPTPSETSREVVVGEDTTQVLDSLYDKDGKSIQADDEANNEVEVGLSSAERELAPSATQDDDTHSIDVNLGRPLAPDVTEIDDDASVLVNLGRSEKATEGEASELDKFVAESEASAWPERSAEPAAQSIEDTSEDPIATSKIEEQDAPDEDWADTQMSELRQEDHADPTIDDFFDAPKSPHDDGDTSWLKGNKKGKKGKKSKRGSATSSSISSDGESQYAADMSGSQAPGTAPLEEDPEPAISVEEFTAPRDALDKNDKDDTTAENESNPEHEQSASTSERDIHGFEETDIGATPAEDETTESFFAPVSKRASKKNKKRKSVVWADADSVPGTPASESGLELIVPPSPERVYMDDRQPDESRKSPEISSTSRKERNIEELPRDSSVESQEVLTANSDDAVSASADAESSMTKEATAEDEWSLPVAIGKKSKKEKKKNKKASKAEVEVNPGSDSDTLQAAPEDIATTESPNDEPIENVVVNETPSELQAQAVSQAIDSQSIEDEEWAVPSKKSKKDKKKKKRDSSINIDGPSNDLPVVAGEPRSEPENEEPARLVQDTSDVQEPEQRQVLASIDPEHDQALDNTDPAMEETPLTLAQESATTSTPEGEPEDFYQTASNDVPEPGGTHEPPSTTMTPRFPADFTVGQHFAPVYQPYAMQYSDAPQSQPSSSNMRPISPVLAESTVREAPSPGQETAEDWYRTSPIMHHAEPIMPAQTSSQAGIEEPAILDGVAEASALPKHVEETQQELEEHIPEDVPPIFDEQVSNAIPVAPRTEGEDDEWAIPSKKSKKDKKKKSSQSTEPEVEAVDMEPTPTAESVVIPKLESADDSMIAPANDDTLLPVEHSEVTLVAEPQEIAAEDEWAVPVTTKKDKKSKKKSKSITSQPATPVNEYADADAFQEHSGESKERIGEAQEAAEEDEWSISSSAKKNKKDKKKKRASTVASNELSESIVLEPLARDEQKPPDLGELMSRDMQEVPEVPQIEDDQQQIGTIERKEEEPENEISTYPDAAPASRVAEESTEPFSTTKSKELDLAEADDGEWAVPSTIKKSKKDKKKKKQTISLDQPGDDQPEQLSVVEREIVPDDPELVSMGGQDEAAELVQGMEQSGEVQTVPESVEESAVVKEGLKSVQEQQPEEQDEWALPTTSKKSKKDKKKKKSLQLDEPAQPEASIAEQLIEQPSLTEEPVPVLTDDPVFDAAADLPTPVQVVEEDDEWALPSSSKKKKDKRKKKSLQIEEPSLPTADSEAIAEPAMSLPEADATTGAMEEQPLQVEVPATADDEPQAADDEWSTPASGKKKKDKKSKRKSVLLSDEAQETAPAVVQVHTDELVAANDVVEKVSAEDSLAMTDIPADSERPKDAQQEADIIGDAANEQDPVIPRTEDDAQIPETLPEILHGTADLNDNATQTTIEQAPVLPTPDAGNQITVSVQEVQSDEVPSEEHLAVADTHGQDRDVALPEMVSAPFQQDEAAAEDEWSFPVSGKKAKKDKKKKRKSTAEDISEPVTEAEEALAPPNVEHGHLEAEDVSQSGNEHSIAATLTEHEPLIEPQAPQAADDDDWAMSLGSKKSKKDKKMKRTSVVEDPTPGQPNDLAETKFATDDTRDIFVNEPTINNDEANVDLHTETQFVPVSTSGTVPIEASLPVESEDVITAAPVNENEAWDFPSSSRKSKKDKKKRRNTPLEISEPSTPANEGMDTFVEEPSESPAAPALDKELPSDQSLQDTAIEEKQEKQDEENLNTARSADEIKAIVPETEHDTKVLPPQKMLTTAEADTPAQPEPDATVDDEWAFTSKKSKKDKKKKRRDIEAQVMEESSATPADSGFATPAESFETSTREENISEPQSSAQSEAIIETGSAGDDWMTSTVTSKKSKKDKKKKRESSLQEEPETIAQEVDQGTLATGGVADDIELVPEAATSGEGGEVESYNPFEVAEQPQVEQQAMDDDQAAFLAQAEAATDAIAVKYARADQPEDVKPQELENPREADEDEWSFATPKSKKDKKKGRKSRAQSIIEDMDPVADANHPSATDLVMPAIQETTISRELDSVPVIEAAHDEIGVEDEWSVPSAAKKGKKDKKKKGSRAASTVAEDDVPPVQDNIDTREFEPEIDVTSSIQPDEGNDVRSANPEPAIIDEPMVIEEPRDVDVTKTLLEPAEDSTMVTPAEEPEQWLASTSYSKPKKDKKKKNKRASVLGDDFSAPQTPVELLATENIEEEASADKPEQVDTSPKEQLGIDELTIPYSVDKDVEMEEGAAEPLTDDPSIKREPKALVLEEASNSFDADIPITEQAEQDNAPVLEEATMEPDQDWATPVKRSKKDKKKRKSAADVQDMDTEPLEQPPIPMNDPANEPTIVEPVSIDSEAVYESMHERVPDGSGYLEEQESVSRDLQTQVDPVAVAEEQPENDEWATFGKKSKKDKKKKRKTTTIEPEPEVTYSTPPGTVEEPMSVDHPELPSAVAQALENSQDVQDESPVKEPTTAEEEWTVPVSAKKSKKDRKKRNSVPAEETEMHDQDISYAATSAEILGSEPPQVDDMASERENMHIDHEPAVAVPSESNVEDKWAMPSTKRSKKDRKKQKKSNSESLEPEQEFTIQEIVPEVETLSTMDHNVADDTPSIEPQAEDFYRSFTPGQNQLTDEQEHRSISAEPLPRATTPPGDVTKEDTAFDVRSPEAEAYYRTVMDQPSVPTTVMQPEVEINLPRKSSKKTKGKRRQAELYVESVEQESSEMEADKHLPRKASEEWSAQPMQVEETRAADDSDGSQVSETTRERRRRRHSPRLTAEHEPADLPRNRALTPPPDHDDLMDTALGIAAGLGLGAAVATGHSTSDVAQERRSPHAAAPPNWSFANLDQPQASVRDSGVHLDSPAEAQQFTRERDSGFPASPQLGQSHGKQPVQEPSHTSLRPSRPLSHASSSEDVSPIVAVSAHKRQQSELEPTTRDRDSALFQSSPAGPGSTGSVAPEFAHLIPSSAGTPLTPTGPSLPRSGSSSDHRRVSPSLRMVRDSQGNLRESMTSPTSLRSKKDSYGNLRAVAGSPLSPRSNRSEELTSNLLDRVSTREVDRQTFSPSPRQSMDRPFSPRHSSLGTIDENTGLALGAAALGLAGGAALMSRESGRGSLSKSRTNSLRNLRQLSATPSSSQQQTREGVDGPAGERSVSMADSYDGYGAAPGSPASPSRPPSLRKRQSLNQVLDLQARVEQLATENRALAKQKLLAERHIEELSLEQSKGDFATQEALQTVNEQLRLRDEEIVRLRSEIETIAAARDALKDEHENKYTLLLNEKDAAHARIQETSRDLEQLRGQHESVSREVEGVVAAQVGAAVAAKTSALEDALAIKDAELQQLRRELDAARAKIRDLQSKILARGVDEVVVVRDEDYFDNACQQLCQHVQQWVLRFSKFSDTRVCRSTNEVRDEKIVDRFDNAILDGSDVDVYLGDRVKRRDVFMSVVMTMIWEFVFTRYLFGMDRDQRQKLKQLEKNLAEVGPASAVQQWRALTLTLLAKRQAFREQKDADTEAVATEILQTLSRFLPPPQNLEQQIFDSLKNVMRAAVKLSIEMRTQKAEYIMLPPLQPEYDTNGDLARKVFFNASLMNERSGETSSNDELEAQQAVVRMVLFPLVVKKGGDEGGGDDEIVVCPAQVLVARSDKGKKGRRSGEKERAQSRMSQAAMTSTHSLGAMSGVEGNVI